MAFDDLEGKQVEIPLFRHEGLIQDHLELLSKHDITLFHKLKAMGLPSEGYFRITTTPGKYYGAAFKDFSVESFATLLGNRDDLDPDSLGGMLHLSGPQVWRVWRIWLMDVTRHDMESCIRYMWNETSRAGIVTIEHINNDLHDAAESVKKNKKGKVTRIVIDQLQRLLPGLKIIEITEDRKGRPKGSGFFANGSDFLTALEDVLSKIKNPSEPKVLYHLSRHELWQKEPFNLEECQKKTKTLRNWLTRCGMTWDMAVKKYYSDI